MRLYQPALDPARRVHAPDRLWASFTPVMGDFPDRHAPFDGRHYGRMEAEAGICAHTNSGPANNCSGWYARVRGLPLGEAETIEGEPQRAGHFVDCVNHEIGKSRCTITASGAHFSEDGSLTLTLYIRPFDLQYRATFNSMGDYLTNAITERGLTPEALMAECHFLVAIARRHPKEARPAILQQFTGSPINHATLLPPLVKRWCEANPLTPHNTADGIDSHLVATRLTPAR